MLHGPFVVCSWDILVLSEAIGATFVLPGNTLSLLMLHSLKLNASLIVSRRRLKVCLYLALLSLEILMSMMHILQEKRYQILYKCTDDGHAPLQPLLLHHLHIYHLLTFICLLPFGKVYVFPLHIPFSILLAMIAFTLLSVHLPCLLLLSQFPETTKR